MGHRLTQIATRTGDDGTTGLGDGSRTRKDSLRVAAMGDVDELNSTIGLLLTEPLPDDIRDALIDIQHDLFDLGGELCIPGFENLADTQVARLDALLLRYNATLPRLQEFILPGGSRSAAIAHVARWRRGDQTRLSPVCEPALRPALRAGTGPQPPRGRDGCAMAEGSKPRLRAASSSSDKPLQAAASALAEGVRVAFRTSEARSA